MNISWHTKTYIEINASSNKKDGVVSIVIDPLFEKEISRGKKINGDIFLFTKKEKQNLKNQGFCISGPGEYEIKEIYIKGFESSPLKTFYIIETEEIRICHLGLLEKEEFLSSEVEEIGDIDILFLPVGSGESLDAKRAIKIMGQIEPRIVIPINYKKDKEKSELKGIKEFLDILGIKKPESVPKLSIKKKMILELEELKVIILE